MCGIAGFWNTHGPTLRDPAASGAQMTQAMRLRGPDDQGVWVSEDHRLVLSHSRLAILDVSSRGHQPMLSADGRQVIVYNGEIYNFREVRSGLEKKGYRFVTGTDTEVVLAAYRCYGVDCLNRFNGMFAFAIWDADSRELFLARDRFGVKPLLYYWQDNVFLFASEMKGLRSYDGPLNLTLNIPAIRRYFYLTYPNSPNTVYNEVRQLDSGHYLLVRDGSVRCARWYDLAPKFREKLGTIQNAESTLRDTLEEAVRDRLVSDVPLGVFLSGGIDSSIVAGLMAKNTGRKVKTYTVGYHDAPIYDESGFAREVSRHFGTDHSEITLSIREGLRAIPDALDYLDQPFGDSSCIPTYLISRETRKEVTVALSGDGGDEVFAGYSKYQAEAYATLFRVLPQCAWSMIRKLVASLPEGRQTRFHEFTRKAKKFLRAAYPDQVHRHCSLMFPIDEKEIAWLVGKDPGREIRGIVDSLMKQISSGTIDRALFTDINLCLKDDMLRKVDLMGMANSLEIRNPYLDYRVVELAAGMPGEWKLMGTERKHILKSAFRDLLPQSVLKREKYGFGIPVGEWLRGEMKGLFDDVVSRAHVNRVGILDFKRIQRIYSAHLAGRRDATPLLWSIFSFQWWANRYL